MHRLYSCVGGCWIVVGHETEALGEIRLFVDKHFGWDNAAEWNEGRGQVSVRELLWQMVDE